MIINNKRYNNIQIYKTKNKKKYFIIIPYKFFNETNNYTSRRTYWITPFWANVETKDLEENWQARFFEQLIPTNEVYIEKNINFYNNKNTYKIS